jgi:hypothetical protein
MFVFSSVFNCIKSSLKKDKIILGLVRLLSSHWETVQGCARPVIVAASVLVLRFGFLKYLLFLFNLLIFQKLDKFNLFPRKSKDELYPFRIDNIGLLTKESLLRRGFAFGFSTRYKLLLGMVCLIQMVLIF